MGQRVDEATVAAEVGVALFGRHAGRIPQAEPSPAPGRGPRRRDLAKPQKGSPSTCGARAMHILALQPNLMSRSAGYATEHDGKIVWRGAARAAKRPEYRGGGSRLLGYRIASASSAPQRRARSISPSRSGPYLPFTTKRRISEGRISSLRQLVRDR